NQVHPGWHGHHQDQPGDHQRAQGPRRQPAGNHAVAPRDLLRQARRDRRRVPAQGLAGLRRGRDPLRQVHRPGRCGEVLHRNRRQRDADARWPRRRWWWRWRRAHVTPAPGIRAAAAGPAAPVGASTDGRSLGRRHSVLSPGPGADVPTWLVTGGAGFIGGNFVLEAVAAGTRVVNLDALTYAGNLDTLSSLQDNPDHVFVHGDIGDRGLVARLLAEYRPDAVINFAAESHVDRSIDGPGA